MSTAEELMQEAREQEYHDREHDGPDRDLDDCPYCQGEYEAAMRYYRPSNAERQAQAFVTVTDKDGWITSIEEVV